jgi:AraC-like DNA-binding protein
MTPSTAWVRASIVVEFRDQAARRGLAIDSLLREAGIDRSCLDDPLRLVPFDSVVALFDLAAKRSGSPAFGLELADSFRPGATGLVGHLVLAAPTVRQALQSVTRYMDTTMSHVETAFTEKGGIGHFTWKLPDAITASRLQFNVFIAGIAVKRMRLAAGEDWQPLSVELEHRELPCPEEVRRALGNRVRYQRPVNRIAIDPGCLAKPMPGFDPSLFAMLSDLAERWLAEGGDDPRIVGAAREEIVARLKSGKASLDTVANGIGIAPRSLQWRLDQVGTSFQKLLNETRSNLAEHLLRDTDKPVTEIAYDLGFSDPSAFTRAARRWFEMSPRAYRRLQRRGEGPKA